MRFDPKAETVIGPRIPIAILCDPCISAEAVRLYAILVDYSSTGRSWPSIKTLSKHLGCCVRQTQTLMAELQVRQLIEVETRYQGRRQTSNAVFFVWRPTFGMGAQSCTGAQPYTPPPHDSAPPGVHSRAPQEPRLEEPGVLNQAARRAAANGPARASEYPLTMAAAGARFPMDESFLVKLVAKSRAARPDVTDAQIAEALERTFRSDQRNAGLWLSTVPEFLSRTRTEVAAAQTRCGYCAGCGIVAEMGDVEAKPCPQCGGTGVGRQT